MPVKRFRPTSPGLRFKTVMDFSELTKKKPEKSLIEVKKKHSGRNNNGHITVRHKGGGTRRQYRIVDFKRQKDAIPAKVAAIEYDPNRSARIALLNYRDGEKRYPRARRSRNRPSRRIGRSGRHQDRQLPADQKYPARYRHSQHRIAAR